MNTNRIVLNETSYFGPGSRSVIPEEVKRRNLKKAFIVTDNDLVKFGVVKQVTDILEQAAIPYTTFAEVKQNPTVTNVKAGVKAYAASAADFIIAIGGGSPTDTAKAIGIITNNPEFSNVVSLEGVANTKNKSVPNYSFANYGRNSSRSNYQLCDYRRRECQENGLCRPE